MLISKDEVQSPLIFCIFWYKKTRLSFIQATEKTTLNRAEQLSVKRLSWFCLYLRKCLLLSSALTPHCPFHQPQYLISIAWQSFSNLNRTYYLSNFCNVLSALSVFRILSKVMSMKLLNWSWRRVNNSTLEKSRRNTTQICQVLFDRIYHAIH